MSDEAEANNHIKVSDIYREQYAHFRSMNDILYKIPPIMTTIIGGLWYFAAAYVCKDKSISAAVFLFSAAACLCFVVVLMRFGRAFSGYIDNLNRLDGEFRVTLKNTKIPSTLSAMKCLLSTAMLVSLLGAANDIWAYHPFSCP